VTQYRRHNFISAGFILLLILATLASGCSEERKREAARIAAELEAKERGETLPPEPVVIDSSQQIVAAATGDTLSNSSVSTNPVVDSSIQKIVPENVKYGEQPDSSGISTEVIKRPETDQVMPPVITDGFTVQVESSPSQSYIEQQVKVFIDRGYDAYLGSVTKEDKIFYRLRVGKYSDRNEAVRVSAEINSMYNLQSWVDKGSW
jgi:cell division septation protein DedD